MVTDPQIHHPEAGDVGETGEHGDLGGNAIDAEREAKLPSGADLDADAAEKAAAAATKPAPNAEEIKAQIAGSLVLAGYSQEEAVKMAETAIANKNK